MDKIKAVISELHDLIDALPPGREKSLALTKLDECKLWVRECRCGLPTGGGQCVRVAGHTAGCSKQ